MKVMKFGGSTIKTPKMLDKVGELIKHDKGPKVIVVSALYHQTNDIREYISQIRTEKTEIDTFISNIVKKHKSLAEKSIKNKLILAKALDSVTNHILKLERLLYGVAYTEELTPRTKDLILSSAERMSAYIMEGVLLSKKINARAYEGDQIGIVTDGNFCNATADLNKTGKNLHQIIIPPLKKGIVPVITGFFGCDEEGRTTTFGRNGSDYSAAVIANALNAKVLELWKDVDGFMSADPNMINNAHTIDKLSYDEAAELAHFGISLLHPRAVEPVRLKNIPIVIKNILNPNKDGTIIVKKGYKTKEVIKSVVYSTDLMEIKVSAAGAGSRPGVLAAVVDSLNNANINIYSVTTSQTHLSLLIAKSDYQRSSRAFSKIGGGMIERIDYQKDIALVCVVGEGSRQTKGLASKIFSAVANEGLNIEIISAGASQVASHFIVNKADLKPTMQAIHNTFCKLKV